MNSEKISKIDAACRQLNTAIKLWFADGDLVSIHTLACSAHQIVHDINQQKGGRDLIYDSLVIKDEYRRQANRIFKNPYNFFKHADKDASKDVELKPDLTEFFIMFTLIGLNILGRPSDAVGSAFVTYYGLCHPNCLTEKGKADLLDKLSESQKQQILTMPKHQFFELYISLRKANT